MACVYEIFLPISRMYPEWYILELVMRGHMYGIPTATLDDAKARAKARWPHLIPLEEFAHYIVDELPSRTAWCELLAAGWFFTTRCQDMDPSEDPYERMGNI